MDRGGSARVPRGLAFHLLTVLAVAVCAVAAAWQWQRAHRTEADAVPDVPVVALADLDPATTYSGMRVRITGAFDVAGEVLVAPRPRAGEPGAWVLTPLIPEQPDGAASSAVGVLRGWVPEGARPEPPPSGTVTVVAVLVADSRQPGAVPVGDPPTLDRVDTGALEARAGYPVRSGWFALQDLDHLTAGQPSPLLVTELPGADVGLSWRNAAYAVQWVAFAGFVVFFWSRFRREYHPGRREQ